MALCPAVALESTTFSQGGCLVWLLGVNQVDCLVSLLSDVKGCGEGHRSLGATRALETLGWTFLEICLVCVP